MKIIIFTPVSKRSAIGRVSSLLTRELLSIGFQVIIVQTESIFDLSDNHVFETQILNWHAESEINDFVLSSDGVVYQIGNNFEFHEGALHWLVKLPGLVCLHDYFLGHLFYGFSLKYRTNSSNILKNLYGDSFVEKFYSSVRSSSFIEDTINDMPMTEWICSQADGVITHSKVGIERIKNSCPGPVRVIPLPYNTPQINFTYNCKFNLTYDYINLLSIGHANPNKRIDAVIRAIGSSKFLKRRIQYNIVGSIENSEIIRLSMLASQNEVNIHIIGMVDDKNLKKEFSKADIVCCLRWPILETASASTIESMMYGKCVIVTDCGFYSEIPNSCVIKISKKSEISDIKESLEFLIRNRSKISSIGVCAKKWASKNFTACNYANQLVEILDEIRLLSPSRISLHVLYNFLSKWTPNAEQLISCELTDPLNIFQRKL